LGSNGTFFKTIDGGNTWNILNLPFSGYNFYFYNFQDGWFVNPYDYPGFSTGIYFTSDAGVNLIQQDTNQVYLIAFIDSTIGYAAGREFFLKYDHPVSTISVDELDHSDEVVVFPNPTKGKINLDFREYKLRFNKLIISDALGRILLDRKINDDRIIESEIDKPGIYNITLVGEKKINYKIVVQ